MANVAIGKTPARNEKCYWDPEKTWDGHTLGDDRGHQEQIQSEATRPSTSRTFGVQGSNARLVPEGNSVDELQAVPWAGRDYIDADGIRTKRLPRWYPNGLANTEYLYYLRDPRVGGILRPYAVKGLTLNKAKASSPPTSAPTLPEQRKIAAILSSVDDAIEKTQAVIDQVQVVKRGLMQTLLTRGLPGRHTRFKQTEIGETGRLGRVASNLKQIPESGIWCLLRPSLG